ncbi:hypothetical protein Q8W71_13240 [Methylobacterium sp. NEAU 140]|uniref:hypothetical protein n=1 Tax=Methylobacterium sp. NEAU 140 TaxID=3064945 RepID=UPI002734AB6D|nr:hypothetical protein [Methylobacterium sp. NEAU 140]MDP4023597.1 hypothetical protein [Methylobacterium sp. NEAU 140]
MPDRPRGRHTTYLVALTTEHGDDGALGPVVYAVMKRKPEEALAAVRALAELPADVRIVGSLSTRTAKALKLKPDEVRPV